MKKLLLLSLISLLFVINSYQSASYAQQQLQGSVYEVMPGRTIDAITETGLSSAVNKPGDPVIVVVNNGFYDNGEIVFVPGTRIEGNVTEVTSSGRTGKNGTLAVRFTTAISPSGKRMPISAIIETKDGSGIIRGGSLKGRIGKGFLRAVEGAAAGAVLGTAMGGITGGKVGKGAAYGTAIGGGIGAATNITRKGNEAEIQSGKRIELLITQPIRVTGSFK
ncbi:MAG: hypothetical protein AB1782_13830 [Cyanobacteriota bacterium]